MKQSESKFEFEAVYYSGPAPGSMHSLTLLGLVFDRLIFPGVYIPTAGLDIKETVEEVKRLRSLPGLGRADHFHMLNMMVVALNAAHWKDFFVFTGQWNKFEAMEPGFGPLTKALEEAVYGPPPENFLPETTIQFSKRLPGDDSAAIHGPSWLSYPANALLYAGRTGTILVNDNPTLPVLGVTGADLKANAKQLATIMALETVKFVLPKLKQLSFEELAEFRADAKETLQPFRRSMLRLSKELNAAILSEMSLEEVQKEARFIVETAIAPELEQLKEEMERPSKPWHRRVVDLALAAPEMAGAFATMPKSLALATALAKATGILVDIRDGQLEKEGLGKRGGFHYLLKIEKLQARRGA